MPVVPLEKGLKSGEVQIVDRHFGTTGEPISYAQAERLGEGRAFVGDIEFEFGGPEETIPGGGAVELRNRMRAPVLVLAGEIIVGGGQDRMFSRSQLLAPGEITSQPVFCVEPHRSHGDSVRFKAVAGMADHGLRMRAVAWPDQKDVWDWVASATRALGAFTKTGTYRAALDGSASVSLEPYWKAVLPAFAAREATPAMVGIAVAFGGRLASADDFATPELFRQYSNELFTPAFRSDVTLADVKAPPLSPSKVATELEQASPQRDFKAAGRGRLDRAFLADTLRFRQRAVYTRYLPTAAFDSPAGPSPDSAMFR